MPRMQIQNAALTAKRNHIDAKMYPIDTLKKVYRVLLFIMRKIIGAVRYDKEISYKNEQGQLKSNPYDQFQIIYNLKRIRRIMKKFQMICPIRKANPYRQMAKATHEHQTCPNLINRHFKQCIVDKVLLTDSTYLTGKRAYLSTSSNQCTHSF